MNIYVSNIASKDVRAVQHVVQLFFEQPMLRFEKPDMMMDENVPHMNHSSPAALWIDVKNDVWEGEVKAKAVLTMLDNKGRHIGQNRHASQCLSLRRNCTAEDERKQIKRAMLHALVKLLEAYTGVQQPWGILTGIRPVKLWHRKVQEGLSEKEIRHELNTETRVSTEKLDLISRIVKRQHEALPDLYALKQEVSLYIGIPYCPTKCAYCTFPAYAIGGQQQSVNAFLVGLHEELRAIGHWLKEHNMRVTTVYFGGGTPTSITADEMDRLYDEMWRALPEPENIREITVEAGRPDTITREKLRVLRKWNIDRISINPQSFTQETLKAIGRHHTVEETIEKYWLAREMGMTNINMDLIIGLPGEDMRHFEHTLEQTEKLMPESLTVHTLSFKRASEMTQNRSKYQVAERDEVKAMMQYAAEWTVLHGYEPYYLYRQKNILGNLENVGYAKLGHESLYNILIMEEMQTIIGIGSGASSKWIDPVDGSIQRSANPKDPRAYIESFKQYTENKLAMLDSLRKKQESVL